jgi:hypothetical protein
MPVVQYRFVATGDDSIVSAFRGIESAAKQSTRGVEQAARASERALSAPRVARAPATRLGNDAEKAAKRAAEAEVREAKRAADAKIREQTRALDHVARIRDRHFRDEQRQGDQAAKAAARAAERAAKDTAAWKERSTKAFERANTRTGNERLRTLTGLGKDAALAGVGAGGAVLGIVGQAAREGAQLQDTANRLSISARGAGETGADASTLRREFEAAAIANPGVKAADVAAGAQSFVAKTGDLGAARRFESTFATVSAASGASVEDISAAAADLFQKFDITSIQQMQEALASLAFQGKLGAFEIKDAASQFAKMSAAAQRFGVAKGPEGLKILGGLTQIARSSTGSPEQAATAVEATFRQLVASSGKLQGMGVNVFEKGSKSKTRDVRDVLVDTIAKSKGSLPKLQEIFGEEGIRGISPLISTFNGAKDGTKGTEAQKTAAGIAAMREALAKAIDAPGDWAEVVKDAAQAQRSSGAQLDAAWESMKATVSQEAVPALLKLVPSITSLAEAGIGPAVVVFTALVEAAGDVVDVLKTIGLLKDKTQTPEQRYQKAKKDLDAFNAKTEKRIGPLSPAEFAEKADLERKLAAADAEAYTVASVDTKTKGAGKGPHLLTAEEFATKYSAAVDADDFDDEEKRSAIGLKAKTLANSLSQNPNDVLASNDWLQGLSGENEKQRAIRQQFQADSTVRNAGGGEAGSGGSDGGSSELRAAAAELKTAAKALQAAKGQPSITGGAQ